MSYDPASFSLISVVFEDRTDGGLRVYSDDVPGFLLSHPDKDAVLRDIAPALETIIGEMLGSPVRVELSDQSRKVPWLGNRVVKEYKTLRAA